MEFNKPPVQKSVSRLPLTMNDATALAREPFNLYLRSKLAGDFLGRSLRSLGWSGDFMRKFFCPGRFVSAAVVFAMAAVGHAQLDFTHDGTDGDFNPTSNVTIDLGLAPTKAWDQPSNPSGGSGFGGNGVYDKAKWAVVFKYTNVNIPAGVTVRFLNHPKNPPVMWLVTGNVNIAGRVIVSGTLLNNFGNYGLPGPGGFRGGTVYNNSGYSRSAGFGPGGGKYSQPHSGYNNGGSFGSLGYHLRDTDVGTVYGNDRIVPLIGGSGGNGYFSRDSLLGQGGGGAILIVSRNSFNLSGYIEAQSPEGGIDGSGGAVRVIADTVTVTPSGRIAAHGREEGGDGRTAIEYLNGYSIAGGVSPVPFFSQTTSIPVIFPAAAAPTLKITKVGDKVAPTDPNADLFGPPDLTLTAVASTPVLIEGRNLLPNWGVGPRCSGPWTGRCLSSNPREHNRQ